MQRFGDERYSKEPITLKSLRKKAPSTEVKVKTANKEVSAHPVCASEGVQCNFECHDCLVKNKIIGNVITFAERMLANNINREAMCILLRIIGSAFESKNQRGSISNSGSSQFPDASRNEKFGTANHENSVASKMPYTNYESQMHSKLEKNGFILRADFSQRNDFKKRACQGTLASDTSGKVCGPSHEERKKNCKEAKFLQNLSPLDKTRPGRNDLVEKQLLTEEITSDEHSFDEEKPSEIKYVPAVCKRRFKSPSAVEPSMHHKRQAKPYRTAKKDRREQPRTGSTRQEKRPNGKDFVSGSKKMTNKKAQNRSGIQAKTASGKQENTSINTQVQPVWEVEPYQLQGTQTVSQQQADEETIQRLRRNLYCGNYSSCSDNSQWRRPMPSTQNLPFSYWSQMDKDYFYEFQRFNSFQPDMFPNLPGQSQHYYNW